MKSCFILLLLLFAGVLPTEAVDTVFVKEARVPVLIEREDNVLFYVRIDASGGELMDEVRLRFGDEVPMREIKAVKLYYGGTEARQDYGKGRFAPVDYISAFAPGRTLEANPSYSVLQSEERNVRKEVVLRSGQKLFPGRNFFWISLRMKPRTSLLTKVSVRIEGIRVDGREADVRLVSPERIVHRMGVGVRHAGDDGVAAYRIPGLVTTEKGTLLGVYDVRHNGAADLQEHIDVGLSRSTDGGKSWEKMRIPLALGENEGLPSAQNGVGDPAILVDEKTNTVWIVAAWTHGMGNQRAWGTSRQGMSKQATAQLLAVKSEDDGETWSGPINLTEQVKLPEWFFLLQGPGRGITMENGMLVFPIQFIDKRRVPHAGIMYSEDRGQTWRLHRPARENTTEAQVVELEPGVLMLNMRDNRGGSRAVAVTEDMGLSWREHVSSRKALQEPVCMASLIRVAAEDNVLGRDLLIFSNPNTTNERKNITIKVSLDGGETWLPEHQLLLDEGYGWGYSCLTMIDRETVGILYESSVANMTFQAVRLKDIVR